MAALLTAVLVVSAQTPRPAAEVLGAAETQAASEHKAIFMIFGASW